MSSYLTARSYAHLTQLPPTSGPVKWLSLLPDGLRFVSGSEDRAARIVYHGLATPQGARVDDVP